MLKLSLILTTLAILLAACSGTYTINQRGISFSWPEVLPTHTQVPTGTPTATGTPTPAFDPTPTLQHDPDVTPAPTDVPPTCDDLDNFVVETTTRLNLRNTPSTSSRIIETLPIGKRMEVQACHIPVLQAPWWYVLTLPELAPGYVWSTFTINVPLP